MYAALMEVQNFKSSNEPTVNLEVLIPPDYHIAYPHGVIQGASLSNDLLRYGLYILNTTASKKYSYEDFVKDSLRYRENIKDFLIKQTEIDHNVTPNLDTSGKFKGFYIPQHCESSSEPCANVFTSYYNDTKFFIDHVNKFKLKLKIYFLGDELAKVIRVFNDRNEKIIKAGLKQSLTRFFVLHWTPSEIIDNPSLNYEAVEMPKCELYEDSKLTCRYEIIPVLTFFNAKAKTSEGLTDLMRNVQFTSLKPIIKMYHEFGPRIENIRLSRTLNNFDGQQNNNDTLDTIYNEIACKWLQDNDQVYSLDQAESWIRVVDTDIEIFIGGM